MSVPALRAVRERFPAAHIAGLAKPWVADLYRRESFADEVIAYDAGRWRIARSLHARRFDCAILFQNAFDAALIAWLARIPVRIGYNRDGRRLLLTHALPPPKPGEIPRHERFYYLELLRRAGIIDTIPNTDAIRLEGSGRKQVKRMIGVSPGAAYGTAKRWLPERFAEAAARVASTHSAAVALFGSAGEREVCESIARRVREGGVEVHNFAGQTSLLEFIDLAAGCQLFLSNDSGAMHIVSALGVPSVTIFGATDDTTTGPTGPWARIVREQVECSPCLL